jgi:RimJ/RimL family protein N-acetyltransferase
MPPPTLSVRQIQKDDIDLLIRYWLESSEAHLRGMGVDMAKMPDEKAWRIMLAKQLTQSYKEKQSYCIIWLVDGKPTGHSNINNIIFGEEAFIHLHLWDSTIRKKGMGTELVKLTLPYFFKNMQLKKIYCEPYALNPAPNKTLEKLGFNFVKEYITVPGWLNFEQLVKRWELSLEKFEKMNHA